MRLGEYILALRTCMGGPADGAGTETAPGFDSFNFFSFSAYVVCKAEKF